MSQRVTEPRTKRITVRYDIFMQSGALYESVRVSGLDEEDCKAQIDEYLKTLQDCYAQEQEEE